MYNWQVLEAWMDRNATRIPQGQPARVWATVMGVNPYQASELIYAYRAASREGKTKRILKREGRTRAAVYSVGETRSDLGKINAQALSDIKVKIVNDWRPTLEHLARVKPEVAKEVNLQVDAVMTGAMKVLEVALASNGLLVP